MKNLVPDNVPNEFHPRGSHVDEKSIDDNNNNLNVSHMILHVGKFVAANQRTIVCPIKYHINHWGGQKGRHVNVILN